MAFSGGAMLAAFCQGAVLGAFVTGGMAVTDGRFSGGAFDWLKPFSIATGLGVVAGYAVLGAGWLIWRTEGEVQQFARRSARPALLVTAAAIALVSVWTPLSLPPVAERWFSLPTMAILAPLPVLAAAAWLTAWRSLHSDREWLTFAASVVLFLAALGGIGASVWPFSVASIAAITSAGSLDRLARVSWRTFLPSR
jgi:cytochrome d ubiquinol oxidase subunit II